MLDILLIIQGSLYRSSLKTCKIKYINLIHNQGQSSHCVHFFKITFSHRKLFFFSFLRNLPEKAFFRKLLLKPTTKFWLPSYCFVKLPADSFFENQQFLRKKLMVSFWKNYKKNALPGKFLWVFSEKRGVQKPTEWEPWLYIYFIYFISLHFK